MLSDDLEQWLQALPLDEPVDIDGESVYLNIHSQGAELGVCLAPSYTGVQLADALRTGFQSALDFDAGLGLSADRQMLVLARWLPEVSAWTDAAEALENILNQASMWRAALAPIEPEQDEKSERNEARIRKLLAGANR